MNDLTKMTPLPMAPELAAIYAEVQDDPEILAEDMMAQFQYQISRRMEEMGLTNKALAERAGMKPPHLSRLLKAGNTSLRTVARLAAALDLRVGALKLIPAEDADEQAEEVAPFVRTEGTASPVWWPTSRKVTASEGLDLSEITPRRVPNADAWLQRPNEARPWASRDLSFANDYSYALEA